MDAREELPRLTWRTVAHKLAICAPRLRNVEKLRSVSGTSIVAIGRLKERSGLWVRYARRSKDQQAYKQALICR